VRLKLAELVPVAAVVTVRSGRLSPMVIVAGCMVKGMAQPRSISRLETTRPERIE
jgi:hypothetical protein